MIIRPLRRKILRITAYVFGSLAALLIAFHFWFINHAEQLLEDLVASQSNGKLNLQVKKFKFNWFSYDMQLRHAVFFSTDTATASTAYRFSVEKIHLRVREIFPLIFEKKMVFDSLHLINPDIQVTKLRSRSADTTRTKKSVSLTQEMGRVYNSIQDALQVLKVKRFQIDNGRFTLANKTDPDELPVTITHIDFHLDNLRVDTSEETGRQKILFSDNVSLQTHDQDIFLPDGRHRLSFKNFRVNILKKIVEFDSCTIAASKGDSARSSFVIFLDKLQLTNIDFDTLYQKEIIKADSVYCTNPRFRLDVELEKRTGKRKAPPRLNDLIQLLTGDLQLAFVVVNNAAFDVNIVRNGEPSSFTSDRNNFEIQGLRIEKNSPHPFTVRSFAMAIRNYENFLLDSAYSMEFDSILLVNNSIYLSNFSLKQMLDEKVINSFRMPRFVLRQLSWDDLVFERKLSAASATLYHPVIDYAMSNKKVPVKVQEDILQALAGIGAIVRINTLDIDNGQINVNFRGNDRLQLQDASLSIQTRPLIETGRIGNFQKTVNHMRFKKGVLNLGDLVVDMDDASFMGKTGRLVAAALHARNEKKNLDIKARNVSINSMQLDDRSFIMGIDGMDWQEAAITVTGASLGNSLAPAFAIKNIRGAHTWLNAQAGNEQLTVFFDTIAADAFTPRPGQLPGITNFRGTGQNFFFKDTSRQVKIDRFSLTDHAGSTMEGFTFVSSNGPDSASFVIPRLDFSPDLNAMINGSVVADYIYLTKPSIYLVQSENAQAAPKKMLPAIEVGNISIRQPEFDLNWSEGNPISTFKWNGGMRNTDSLDITGLSVRPGSVISADRLQCALGHFAFTSANKRFDAGRGEITLMLSHFKLARSENDGWEWQAAIDDLSAKQFTADSLGSRRGKLEIQSVRLNNLMIGTSTLFNLTELARQNKLFKIKDLNGEYTDQEYHAAWFNAGYDKQTRSFQLDSFTFRPIPGKDEFMAAQHYQTDYTTIKTGAIAAGPFDIDLYLKDKVVKLGMVKIYDGAITSFRDKRIPFKSGITKNLPTSFIQKLPVRLSIDTVVVRNGNIEYAELNEKSGETGIVTVSRLQASLFPVANYDLRANDSLHIVVSGYLMDSAQLQLDIREAYADDLSGFSIRGIIHSADARILNPILGPLAMLKLESGFIDSIKMSVRGGEYLAEGEMKAVYHGLKIKLLNNQPGKKGRYRRFAGFLANTFVIKNNNRTRIGTIFFERVRDRSPYHYLVKIAVSGISSSIGLKNNKKLLRQYKKELGKRNLTVTVND